MPTPLYKHFQLSLASLALLLPASGGAALLSPPAQGELQPPVLLVAPAGEPGDRLTVTGTLIDGAGHPIANAELHVYQTDASGRYTPLKPMDEPHARLGGRLRTGAEGRFELRTIRPGGYAKAVLLKGVERHIPAHIHIDVRADGHAARHYQMVFADDPLLRDPYWSNWVKAQRRGEHRLALRGGVWIGTLVLELD